jgi:pimeloyl-ACP methyl ester carboxylesterase
MDAEHSEGGDRRIRLGARSADVVAALWPDRCRALVSVSGYIIVNLAANLKPLPPQAEYRWWYQYYFATDQGEQGYRENTRLQQVDLEDRITHVVVRRRHLRSQRRRLRQSITSTSSSTTTDGGSASPRANRSTTNWNAAWPPCP